MNMDVELDRRMLDFIVGLDTEFSELVEGSHLYTSSVKLERYNYFINMNERKIKQFWM